MNARRVLLFPGQGAQQVGMGFRAAQRSARAREIFDRVDAVLGMAISSLCFEGPAERLQETRYQQPAIFACSLALYAAWQELAQDSVATVAAAGHSLGEYTALVAAGALQLEDGARLVALRGRLMQEAADRTQGGMYAILGLPRARLLEICHEVSRVGKDTDEVVVLANDNTPTQQVISGSTLALERAVAAAKAAGARRTVALKVAGAFHSPLMQYAAQHLSTAVRTVPLQPCRFPVIANSTCESLYEPDAIRAELIRQVTAPVRWMESVLTLADSWSPIHWADSGPGTVVAGLVQQILPDAAAESLARMVDL